MLKLKMRLDGKILSVNKTYLRGKNGGVYLAPEVKQYRDEVFPIVQNYLKECNTVYEGGVLTVKVDVFDRFYTKGDDVRTLDIDNFAKNIIDATFPPLGINDKYVFTLLLRKVHYVAGQPYIVIKITEDAKGNPKKAKSNKKVVKKL